MHVNLIGDGLNWTEHAKPPRDNFGTRFWGLHPLMHPPQCLAVRCRCISNNGATKLTASVGTQGPLPNTPCRFYAALAYKGNCVDRHCYSWHSTEPCTARVLANYYLMRLIPHQFAPSSASLAAPSIPSPHRRYSSHSCPVTFFAGFIPLP